MMTDQRFLSCARESRYAEGIDKLIDPWRRQGGNRNFGRRTAYIYVTTMVTMMKKYIVDSARRWCSRVRARALAQIGQALCTSEPENPIRADVSPR